MPYMVMHGAKFKSGSVVGIDKHNMRSNEKYSNQNIDTSLSYNNMEIKVPEVSLYQDIKKDIQERVINQGGRVTKASVWCCEFVIGSSREFFNSMPMEQQKQFFVDAYKAFERKIGSENIKSAVVHFDEVGGAPHMHLDFVPIMYNSLTAKLVMDRQFLRDIQSDIPVELRQIGYDILPGERNGKKWHLEPDEFKDVQDKKARELRGSNFLLEKELNEKKAELGKKKEQIAEIEQQIESKKSEFNKLDNSLQAIKKEFEAAKVQLGGISRIADDLTEDRNRLIEEINKYKGEIDTLREKKADLEKIERPEPTPKSRVPQYDRLIYKGGSHGVGLYEKDGTFVKEKFGTKLEMEKALGCKISDPYEKLGRGR